MEQPRALIKVTIETKRDLNALKAQGQAYERYLARTHDFFTEQQDMVGDATLKSSPAVESGQAK